MLQVYGQCELEPGQPPVESRGEVPHTELQKQACTCGSNKGTREDSEGREAEGPGGRDEGRRRGGGKRTEDGELVSLKRALAQQVQRLRELCASKEERVGQVEEEERERRVAAEHVAAMARKLYDLQRQVNVCHPWCV